MAQKSNNDLRAEISLLGGRLGIESPADLEEMKQPALLAMLSELEGKWAAHPANVPPAPDRALLPAGHKRPTVEEFVGSGYESESYERAMAQWEHELVANAATGSAPGRDEPVVTDSPAATTYLVAEGKMVTTLRGPMGAFQEVYARDFVHGQTDLDELVALGTLTPKS